MKIDVYKYSIGLSFFVFLGATILTALFYLPLYFLSADSFLRGFFFRCWYVQALTTILFFAALLFVACRFFLLQNERRTLQKRVALERLDEDITPELAREMLEAFRPRYKDTISFRRLGELLRAYLHGEEVVRLNQELSRRDVEQIEGGHLILNALKQLIPVLGFLGTVVGLSLGMAKFPELSESAGNIESLRTLLKDLAASLSVSFDTTLLALGYTIVIVLLSSFLRREEEEFVIEVDDKARYLIAKLSRPIQAAAGPGDPLDGIFKGLLDRFDQGLASVAENFANQVGALVKRLEEVRDGIQNLPHYEVIVQPVKDGHGQR
jgi:biopolymer transport protein ExbB/TolQ